MMIEFPLARPRTRWFTLVELLVVLAIIGVLASLLLPALRRAKTMAVRVHCLSQQRQLAMATGAYVADHNGYLPNKNGAGARYDLASRTGSVRELYYQGYLRDPRFFRCPALVGNGGWNTNVKGYLDAGYLGYQYLGLSTWLWSIPGAGPYTWGAGVYWISAPRIVSPSQYMLIGCNIIDDLAAQSYHNYMEMNWTAHARQQADGANIVMLDGTAKWYPYTRAPAYAASSGANFIGPYWGP